MAEKLQLLRDRYYLTAGPLLLLLGIGAGTSRLLFWVAAILLIVLSANKLAPHFR